MAQCDSLARIRGLKLETHPDEQRRSSSSNHAGHGHSRRQRPPFHGPFASEDTIRACATPPIGIPGQYDETSPTDDAEALNDSELYINQFLRDRETSLQFQDDADKAVGHRHHHIPLKPPKRAGQNATRGRSLAHALSEYRAARAHSESERSHYDPQTGRHLSQYSDSPPKDEPHVGEARFPLLQETVDALARRSIDQPMSMTSESTVSPVEEAVATPSDISGPSYISAPINISPGLVRHFSTSYESPRARSQRKASERWRDGEAAQDFFSRAGSLKKSDRGSARRSARRDTQSTKSPHSAASSFLRGFSISSATEDAGPPPVDAEGATVGEDYVLGKQIGFGGFSVIREVKQMSAQTGEQRTLAVKIVRKHIEGKTKTENDVAQAEFEHEIDLWRLLNHKHILGLEAVYELKEATFCFVPLNTGGTLFDLINNNRQGLPPELVANYSYQLASALRYLHLDARVVHRDIKLENCLIDTTHGDPGLLRVCDFGLAEWLSSDSDSATSGSPSSASERERTVNKYFGPAESSTSAFAGGSLEYAAPEILRIATTSSGRIGPDDIPPEKTIVSSAVDIWAMGVCMYALLMGRRPFQDNFRPRVVMAILAGDWPKHALKDKAGVQPYSLVKSCLTMDATQRPGISEVIQNAWFDEARSSAESSDAESEGARASVWRL